MEEFKSSTGLRRCLVLSVLVTAAMAAPVLCLGAVADGVPGRGATVGSIAVPTQPDASAEATTPSCDQTAESADFRASFAWSNDKGTNMPMEIRVGKNGAEIFQKSANGGSKCVAVCRLKSSGLDRKVASSAYPAAVDMDCQAAGFNGLASPAALVFSSQGQSVLRFGSWVSGYHDATLAVGVDHLSGKLGS